MTQLITIKELAQRLKISTVTLYFWRKEGKIPYIVMPSGQVRFDPVEIEEWMEKRKVKALPIGR